MKKITLLFIAVVLLSCAGTYNQASHTSSKVYIGMPIKDFKALTKRKSKLEAMESGYTVYRMNDYDAWSGFKTDTKFFYFDSDGKLYKVDGGEFKQQRYQIEVIDN
ncbi:hypothetical protein [Flagellimonas marinaquae]|uniref:hypothetical protein n=1 Tax=Flagellimonas marinaquae TaxID=254955 RepID=UPI0020753E4E|nr:hypothetical protein [Allomuricauda aquimarina]USD24066.1 hypothetical protein MJO53_10265 [Allomuricauda aquimarina]